MSNAQIIPLPQKKSAPPIMLRLPPALDERLSTASARTRLSRQEIIRDGLVAKLDQLEAQSAEVPVIIATQLREAARLGLNVERVLAEAIGRQARAARAVIDPFPHRD